MTPDQISDRERILAEFAEDFRRKYNTGQAEHGGNLWEKTGMIERAIDEVLDFVAYLYTLRRQLQHLSAVPLVQEAYAHNGHLPSHEPRPGPDGDTRSLVPLMDATDDGA
jgi:hypothetical protein